MRLLVPADCGNAVASRICGLVARDSSKTAASKVFPFSFGGKAVAVCIKVCSYVVPGNGVDLGVAFCGTALVAVGYSVVPVHKENRIV